MLSSDAVAEGVVPDRVVPDCAAGGAAVELGFCPEVGRASCASVVEWSDDEVPPAERGPAEPGPAAPGVKGKPPKPGLPP